MVLSTASSVPRPVTTRSSGLTQAMMIRTAERPVTIMVVERAAGEIGVAIMPALGEWNSSSARGMSSSVVFLRRRPPATVMSFAMDQSSPWASTGAGPVVPPRPCESMWRFCCSQSCR